MSANVVVAVISGLYSAIQCSLKPRSSKWNWFSNGQVREATIAFSQVRPKYIPSVKTEWTAKNHKIISLNAHCQSVAAEGKSVNERAREWAIKRNESPVIDEVSKRVREWVNDCETVSVIDTVSASAIEKARAWVTRTNDELRLSPRRIGVHVHYFNRKFAGVQIWSRD